MRILVFNRGSSSLKSSLYVFEEAPTELQPPTWEADEEVIEMQPMEPLLQRLVGDVGKVDCIGHRLVHGGDKYRESVWIDEAVKREIRRLAELAPLHNLADLEVVETLEKLFPGTPHLAVFDTAFHRTLPQKAVLYPGPYSWFVEEGIQRYGFHGTSFQYCARRAVELLGKEVERMVICHLGAGASLCAVQKGKSVDTTMGFTPLEGLMMDTRSGSIDPGILLYLLEKKGRRVEALSKELYESSGLLGLSGISGDMRDILKKVAQGDTRATLTFEIYLHRLKKEIGSMVASLNGIDALVFTGGIGENCSLLRERVCRELSFLELALDPQKREEGELSLPQSKVKILLIHTKEAFEIARTCWMRLTSS